MPTATAASRSGEIATYIPAVSMPGAGGMMAFPEAYDFYTDAMKTYAPTYDNRVTLKSVEYLIADHSAEAVPLIAPTALLMIHGEKDADPAGDGARASSSAPASRKS